MPSQDEAADPLDKAFYGSEDKNDNTEKFQKDSAEFNNIGQVQFDIVKKSGHIGYLLKSYIYKNIIILILLCGNMLSLELLRC